MTSDRSRILLLVAMLTVACAAVLGVALTSLYQVLLDGQKARLVDVVRAQARTFEGIAAQERMDAPPGGDWRKYALMEIRQGHEPYPGLGETGELTFGSREDDRLVFHLRKRHMDGDDTQSVPWDAVEGEPMRRALSGQSGVDVVPDYRGTQVLAAYEPVALLGMGLVAKIDMAELRRPFITAGLLALGVGAVVVVVGAMAFFRVTMPMLRRQQLNERRYRELFEHIGSGVMLLKAVQGGRDFTVVEINSAGLSMDGFSRDEVVGHAFGEVFPAAGRLGQLDALKRVHATGQPERLPMSFYQDERISGWREHHFYRLPSGEVVAIYDDVTDRKRAEANLQMTSAVFQHTGEGILVTDPKGIIQRVNPAFTEITGYAPEEAVGKTPALLKSDHQAAEFYLEMWSELEQRGRWQGEIWNRRKDGEAYLEWLTINAVHDESGQVVQYVAVFDDISELHEKEQRLRHQAYHDALTGLPNRTLMTDRLDHAIAEAERGERNVAVLFLDLDRFKVVNDSLGHDVGDDLLVAVAQRLRANLRRADTVARLGGDEFVIICSNWTTITDVALVAEKTLEQLAEPFEVAGHDLHVGGSVGVALYPADGLDARSLLKNADTAMYAVKEGGRDGYRFFDRSMNAQAMERLTLEAALRRALERGEFELHYQPKIELADGRMAGSEALVRWRHPEQGMISPARFIPLAEETGLVVPLGDWVLRTAAAQAAAWMGQGRQAGPIAVNVSARQLTQPDFARKVADIYAAAGIPAHAVDLEITETAIMRDPDQAAAILAELAEMGIRVVLDDFGVGYSSLGYLKRLPISVLKMDRSFISDLPDDAESAALALGIVQMSAALGIEVVAEGVETEAQATFLRGAGCRLAQGWLYAPALPAAQVEERFLVAEPA